MHKPMTRRRFHQAAICGCATLAFERMIPASGGTSGDAQTDTPADHQPELIRKRIEGMLIGSYIGDAAGGPVEFKAHADVSGLFSGVRGWDDDRSLTESELAGMAEAFRLLSYDELRPDPQPYAHWTEQAEAGTVTDDSRHKFILLNALRDAAGDNRLPVTRRDLAAAYDDYCQTPDVAGHEGYAALCAEWLLEYGKAARWVLGERDRERALPTDRLWGGIATNAGQMALLPLAGVFPGQPEQAYRAAYSLGFIDNGVGKDINSAVVAGLASALTQTQENVEERWTAVIETMKQVDPHRYGDVPWVQRSLTRWLRFAEDVARRAAGSPGRLFKLLETEGEPIYHWDAHFTFASAFAILILCRFNVLAAMQLALEFGYDTDSNAQLLGAFAGAVHGPDVFPNAMRQQVVDRLEADYGESLEEQTMLLMRLSAHEGSVVTFDDESTRQ